MVVFGKRVFENWKGGYAWYYKLLLLLVLNAAIIFILNTLTDSLGLTDNKAYDKWRDSERWKDNYSSWFLSQKGVSKESYCYECPSTQVGVSGFASLLGLVITFYLVGFFNKEKVLRLAKEKIDKDPDGINNP